MQEVFTPKHVPIWLIPALPTCLSTSQTTHKQIKAAPQSIPSSLSEHIYEIVEKSSQKQFEDSMENECSCNLTRVTHKELDHHFHPKWQ
jgi:hypothetical protein